MSLGPKLPLKTPRLILRELVKDDIPALIGVTGLFRFLPLVGAPLIYALLWRFGVSPLNQLFR